MGHYGKAPAVRIQGARLAYGGHLLFDKLNLEIPAARTTGLLGPSGVGKTSLLRLVAGLAADSEGTVADAAGRPLDGRIAYMAQQDLLLPWLGALDNVLIGLRLRGEKVRGAERHRAHDLLVRVGLGGRTDARPAALSGGMRQRVALARTLMEDRPVVLMDEPFSGLDAITRYELQALAAEVLAGRSVLVVTHDPLEALRLGHRLLVLAGRPAVLDDSVQPPDDAPPRDAARQDVLELQARLLDRLSLALEATR